MLGEIITYIDEIGVSRPAIVVAVNEDSTVNVQVFLNGNGVLFIPNYTIPKITK